MNLDELVAIDTHTHAEVSCCQPKDPWFEPYEQLDRNMYQRTNKVLEAAGGKWNRKAQAHLFDDDAFTRIDQIILTGQVEVPKDEFNFFPTRRPLSAA